MRKLQVEAQRDRTSSFGAGEVSALLKVLAAGILLCLSVAPVAAQVNPKNVLVLFSSFGRNMTWPNKIEPLIRRDSTHCER